MNTRQPTVIKTATVRIMRSYDYSHFEHSLTIHNENGVTFEEIKNHRKMCATLVDEAVNDYERMKESLRTAQRIKTVKGYLTRDIEAIMLKSEAARTDIDNLKMKAFNRVKDLKIWYDYQEDDLIISDEELSEIESITWASNDDPPNDTGGYTGTTDDPEEYNLF